MRWWNWRRTEDFSAEVEAHLDLETERFVQDGLDPAEARAAARRAFGNVTRARERFHDAGRPAWITDLLRDLRYALRGCFRNPGFTAVAVLTLALGIGATSTVFVLVNELLLRPLPVDRPDELMGVYGQHVERPDQYRAFSYPDYRDLREGNTALAGLTAFGLTTVGLDDGELTKRTLAALVSANYFTTMGTDLVRGRAFSEAEEQPDSAIPVAVVSHAYWERQGHDPALIGATIRVNRQPFTVIGVAASGFSGTSTIAGVDLWMPLGMYDRLASGALEDAGTRSLADRTHHPLLLVGRLQPGSSAGEAETELRIRAAQLATAYPVENGEYTITLAPLSNVSISSRPQSTSEPLALAGLFMGMAAVVLLIACLNLANAQLARGMSRRREVAIRLANGGGRVRILRQLLTEGLVLALLGGVGGVLLAFWVANGLLNLVLSALPIALNPSVGGVDARVLIVTAGFSLLSLLLFALGPSWRLSRANVMTNLKTRASETAGPHRWFQAPRNLLAIAQIALSLALLFAAGLFVRGAARASSADPGFALEQGVVAEFDTQLAGYGESQGRAVVERLLERVQALPAVDAASIASGLPFSGVSRNEAVWAGRTPDAPSATAQRYAIAPGYFETVGLPLLRGRDFVPAEADSATARVVIVDEPLAQRLWPDEEALGQFLLRDEGPGLERVPFEVVGIVPGVRQSLLDQGPVPHVYLPIGRQFPAAPYLHVRVTGGPEMQAAMLGALRREIRAIDENLPILSLRTLQDHRDASVELAVIRIVARLFTLFGVVALFLAVVGLYGVKAFNVSRRTQEIGIRRALGGTSRDVLWLVLREGLVLTGFGLGLGLLLAAEAGQLLGTLLYEVSPLDPLVMLAATLVLGVTALAATYIPARRAARVAPWSALRYE